MPGQNPSPIPAILAELNLRDYSGQELFIRSGDGSTVSMATFTTSEGRYEDWLDFLHGRASQPGRDFVTLASNSLTATTITVGIDSNDLFYVECDVENFTLFAAETDFGLDGSEVTGSGPPFRLTANDQWVRGPIQNAAIFITLGTAGLITIPPAAADQNFRAQSVVTLLRELGDENDADDPTNTNLVLETIDNAALTTTTTGRIRWLLNETGHIAWYAPSGITSTAITWISTGLRDLMGFSGNETVTVASGLAYQVAAYPAQAAIIPTRPLERITRSAERVDAAVRLTNGRIAGNQVGTFQSVSLDFWIDGPADSRDLHRHWTERVVPYLTRGSRVSWYGEWGDPRRGLLSYDVKGSQATYDTLYTSEKNGERGRFRGRVAPDWSGPVDVAWPSPMRRRAPANLRLEKAED